MDERDQLRGEFLEGKNAGEGVSSAGAMDTPAYLVGGAHPRVESRPLVLMQVNPIIAFVTPLPVPELELAFDAPVAVGPGPAMPALRPNRAVGHAAGRGGAAREGEA